ncbi:hypothetical protein PRNP1_011551 [Phytophthora ramorum]
MTSTTRRRSPWLHAPVFVRHEAHWVHGQVVEILGRDLMVQPGNGTPIRCRATSAHKIDPIIALLLGQSRLSPTLTPAAVREGHATVLSRLLGDQHSPGARPTRDIAKLLAGLVEDDNLPDGTAQCAWVSPADGQRHLFSLQHAVDYVFVHESSARRISKPVRESVGETFFSPPRPMAVSTPPLAHVPTTVTQCSQDQPDSLFDDDNEADASEPVGSRSRLTATGGDRQRLVLEELAAFPDVLERYLAARGARPTENAERDMAAQSRHRAPSSSEDNVLHDVGPRPKRQRCISDNGLDEDSLHHRSKLLFRPTPSQRQVHDLTHAPLTPGTSAHEFVTSLLAHNAVTFAPHPATLTRLYDFAFGVHGLSILHLNHLDPLARVGWVLASKEKGTKINMQNFSSAVELPTVAATESLAQIKAALDSLKTYCDAFGSLSTCRVVQALLQIVQETAGLELWEATDLKYLIYWIDTALERYRSAVADDARTGQNTRMQFHATVTPADPELQRFTQLVTAKKVQLLLHGAGRELPRSHERNESGWNGRSKYGTFSRGQRGMGAGWDPHQRQQQFASASSSKVPPHIRALIPRVHGRSICMKFLSVAGCPGDAANPDECVFFNSRCHIVPTSPLPGPLADYIDAEFKGLRKGVRRE